MNTFNQALKNEGAKDVKKMNLKEVEEMLKNVKVYEANINEIELEIADLEDLHSIELTGMNYDNLIKTNNLFSKTELQAIKELEIQRTIDLLEYKKRHLERLLRRIKNAIDTLSDIEKQIIQMKCIENMLWRSITIIVNLEDRQCRAIKKRALKKISKIMVNENVIKL